MRRTIWLALLTLTACAPVAVTQPVLPTPTRQPARTSMPAPEWADLSPYRAAMRPEFAGDVDQFSEATQYRIELDISPDLSTVTGRQAVHYVNTETAPLDAVYFRLLANARSYGGKQTVTALRVNGVDVQPIFELSNTALRVEMQPPLPPGDVVDFHLDYVTAVPTTSVAAGYNQFGMHRTVLALPNLYPFIPVYDDEGWNVELAPGYGDAVYSDTSLYRVTITAPADQIVVASGACDASSSGATKSWRCVSGPMRDFMIVASADYVVESTEADGVIVNSYFLAEHADAGRDGLRFTADAVRSYQRRIGAYPFAELDLVETPTTAGGIEYPGLIVVAEDLYEDSGTFHEFATVHEAAHQWWYSLIGNDQVDDPWLDEALTQYTSILYFRDVYGEQAAQSAIDQAFAARHRRALNDDEDMRADLPVASYSDTEYGRIVYGKAPLFFDALYNEMGDEAYNAFLRDYFEAHRYGIAHVEDLLTAAAGHLDRATIDKLLEQWITTPE